MGMSLNPVLGASSVSELVKLRAKRKIDLGSENASIHKMLKGGGSGSFLSLNSRMRLPRSSSHRRSPSELM